MSLSPSLGMWKDSAINLADMVKSKESMDEKSMEEKSMEESESSEISLGLTRDSFLNLASLAKKSSSTESVKATNDSMHSIPSATSSGLAPSESDTEEVTDSRYSAFQEDYSDYAGYDME
jgi:hypothetical protein